MPEQGLDIQISEEGGVTVVAAAGPVDSATIDLFREKLEPLCAQPGARVLLDCQGMTYINSRGIGLLVKYHRSLLATRGRFAMCCLNSKLVRTMDLLQLGKTLASYAGRSEALAAVR